MPDPQRQLFQLLTESGLRGNDTDRIHKAAMQQAPQRQETVQEEISRLRDQIQREGIGGNPQAEDRYLMLLHQNRQLDQLQMMNADQLTAVSSKPDPELQKALDYGELLISVYGEGVLVKAATPDITSHIAKLRRFSDNRAEQLAGRLEELF